MTKLYTAEEVYESGRLPYKPRTLMEKARKGEIGCVQIGRKRRFTDEGIDNYLAAVSRPLGGKDAKPSRNPRYSR